MQTHWYGPLKDCKKSIQSRLQKSKGKDKDKNLSDAENKQKRLFEAFQAVLISKAGYDSNDHIVAILRITTLNTQNILSEYTLIIYQQH